MNKPSLSPYCASCCSWVGTPIVPTVQYCGSKFCGPRAWTNEERKVGHPLPQSLRDKEVVA